MFRNQLKGLSGLKDMITKITTDESQTRSPSKTNSSPDVKLDANHSNDSTESLDASEADRHTGRHGSGEEAEGFLCPLCLIAFASAEDLSEHYSSQHFDEYMSQNDDIYQCKVCKMKFSSHQHLESHCERYHRSEQSVDCVEEVELLRAERIALRESNALLSNECHSLRQQLNGLYAEKKDMEIKLSNMSAASVNDDSAILKKELVRVQKLMNDMSIEREAQKEQIDAHMKGQFEAIVSERDALRLQYEQLRAQMTALQLESSSLKDENFSLNNTIMNIQEKCKNNEKLEENVENIKKQLTEEIHHSKELQKEIDIYRDQLTCEAALHYNIELNEKSQVIESQSVEINSLSNKLNFYEKNATTLMATNNELTNKIKINETKMKEILAELEEKCSQIDKMDTELKQLTQQLDIKEKQFLQNKLELDNSVSALNDCQQSCQAKDTLITQTQLSLEELNKDYEKLKLNLLNSQASHTKILAQLNNKNEEINLKDEKLKTSLELVNNEVIALRATIQKEKSRNDYLQTSYDQVLGTKLEIEARLSNIIEEKRAVIERCIASEEECDKLKIEVLEIRHKLDESVAALHELGRENQCLQIEQTKYNNRKWADDNDAIYCFRCSKTFNVTNRKHHCRNCGQIFCNECSSKSAVLALSPKPVRVCDNCHQEINRA